MRQRSYFLYRTMQFPVSLGLTTPLFPEMVRQYLFTVRLQRKRMKLPSKKIKGNHVLNFMKSIVNLSDCFYEGKMLFSEHCQSGIDVNFRQSSARIITGLTRKHLCYNCLPGTTSCITSSKIHKLR